MAAKLENKINRIQTNVTNALAKIAEKGVVVPDGANSDDLPGLIDAIETGSGGGTPEICTVTLTFGYSKMGTMNRYMPKVSSYCCDDNESGGVYEEFESVSSSAAPANVVRTFKVDKNAMIVIGSPLASPSCSDGIILLNVDSASYLCYRVTSDGTITVL